MSTSDGHDEDLKPVKTPSGGTFWVFDREVNYYNDRAKRYLNDNHFQNVSDLQDVDRMLNSELMVWRWQTWVSQEKDYWGDPVDVDALQKRVKESSTELRQLKASLGIDKVTRDKQRGEDSVSKYIENLKIRAKEFGINRERQLDKALELFQQLSALFTLHDNSTDDEQRELHVTIEDIKEWIRTTAIPEFNVVDAYFREHQQKTWIRDQ